MYTGKDETYKEILKKLSERIGKNKETDLAAILASMIELLEYLDEKEEKKCLPTFD